ncbi:MAG: efflux transporter outer membrane subunit [Brachymonas sp.]|nr:efflux transporter outer membrane subunit [Brachymonas sp.]
MKVFAVEKRSFPRRHATTIAAACAAALLAGCANTPYQQPALNLPAQWQHAAEGQTQTAADATYGDRWWTAFGDEQLNTLIDLALQRNNNLAAAAYTVRNAQLEAGNAAGDRLPTPSAGLNYNRSRELTGAENTNRSYNANLGVSWEIDLWGKLAAAQRRAEWEARATEQDRQATAQALVATVATIYWELATLNHKITSQQQSVTTAAKTLELAQVQHQAGAISGLGVAQARQTEASQRAMLADLEQQRVEKRNALAILFDAPPEQLPEAAHNPHLPDLAQLPPVPAGLPASILARRPDLQAAEQRLRKSLVHVDVVRTSYYPTLSLTGALGGSSTSLSNVLANPVATLGAGLALPFLRLGEMQRNTAIARNSYEQAIIHFRQTLYAALADAENALSARTQLQQQSDQQAIALEQAKRAEQLTEVQYRAGAVPLKTWLDAQESRRSATLAWQNVQLARAINQVTLYKALGGSAVLPAVTPTATN